MKTPARKKKSTVLEMAEPFEGPIDIMIGRVKAGDMGAPFEVDNLEALCDLKEDNLAEFQRTLDTLQKAGVETPDLNAALKQGLESKKGRPSQAEELVAIGEGSGVDLFHDGSLEPFAFLQDKGTWKTWPVNSGGFKRWLIRAYRERTKRLAGAEPLKTALRTIETTAIDERPERPVHTRAAVLDGTTYIDLANKKGQVLEVGPGGWRVVEDYPVRFLHLPGLLPLPVPVQIPLPVDGPLEELRDFLNVDDDGFILALSWLLSVLRGSGPYPLLVISGEAGSAKSTFAGFMRELVDPNDAPLSAMPADEDDLFVLGQYAHVLSFDNIGGNLTPGISNALCQIAIGGSKPKRKLYTVADVATIKAKCPVILNGITEFVTQADLADRAIFLSLEHIPDSRRRSPADMHAAFEEARPRILGALVEILVHGLDKLPSIDTENLPRMADFGRLGEACETAYAEPGTFAKAYRGNRNKVAEAVVENNPVALAIYEYMFLRRRENKGGLWMGTAAELLSILDLHVGEGAARSQYWPKTSTAMGNALIKHALALRKLGVVVNSKRSASNGGRIKTIQFIPPKEPAATTDTTDTTDTRDPPLVSVGKFLNLNDITPLTDTTDTCVPLKKEEIKKERGGGSVHGTKPTDRWDA